MEVRPSHFARASPKPVMPPKTSCPTCSRAASSDHVFCGGCGAQLLEADEAGTMVREYRLDDERDKCASCNAPLDDDVSFCTGCGAPRGSADSGVIPEPPLDLRQRLERATAGEYKIVSHLGRGGMGSVFLALDESLHRHVAIKVMAPALVQDHTMQERFRTEARIVATLRHPGIVNIHGLRVVDDLYFFVMDYVEGATLRSLIRSYGPLPIHVVQAMVYEVASALQHAHSEGRGIIHRDVKPSNIILGLRGNAVVMDFGISKAADAPSGPTMTGMVVGTPEYMSPEQCRGGEISPASDQYSLGLVAYAMLTGAPPFTGQHWNVLSRQTTEKPTPIRQLRPDCPEEVAGVVERMLRKPAKDRWPDVLTAAKELGGTVPEDGSPVRSEIGRLVEELTGGVRTATPVVSVTIDGVPEKAREGELVPVTVTPIDGVGRVLHDREYTLESTNPSVLEVVSPAAVRARQAGSAVLVARCETAEASRPLVVTSPIASLMIEAPPDVLRPGERVQLQASAVDEQGLDLGATDVVWASSDPAVAVVSPKGELSARGPGNVTIFATYGGHSATKQMEVAHSGSGTLTPVHAAAAAPPEASEQEPAAASPSRRHSGPLWLSAGLAVAVVLSLWAVPRLSGPGDEGAGTTEVPAQTTPDPAPTPPLEPTLIDVLLGGEPLGSQVELRAGDVVLLQATARAEDGEPLDVPIQWETSDAAVVGTNGSGQFVAVAAGGATITVAASGLRRSIEATVVEPVERLAVTTSGTGSPPPPVVDLLVGETLSLDALVLDEEGTAVARAIEWTSSNPPVASVDAGGVIRAGAAGTADVTARAGDLRRDLSVRVTVPEPGTLLVTVRPWAYVSIDGERQGEDQRRMERTLPPGTYSLLLEHPTEGTFDTTVVVRSGETTAIDRQMGSGSSR